MLSIIENGPIPTAPNPFNMAAHVLEKSTAQPDKTALIILRTDGAERWSYAKLRAAVLGVAAGLRAMGLPEGAKILLRLGNEPAFPIVFLGALAAGMVPVVTSSQLTKPEITRMASDLTIAAIVAGDGVALPDHPAPIIGPDQLSAMMTLPPSDFHMGDAARAGYVVFTSGTSGRPMAVLHAHRAILARSAMHDGWEGLTHQDRLLHAGAFNWTYTLGTGLMDPWRCGATALVPHHSVAIAQLPLLLKRFDVTIFAAAPGVYRQMLRSPLPPLPHLRHGLSAGEALPAPLRSVWESATGTQVHEALGMSEISTFISGSPSRPAPFGSSGYAQNGRIIAALGPDGMPVPRGMAGELAIDRTDPGLMLGYLNAPEASAARIKGRWFTTGDHIEIAQDGAVTYLGRGDDLMNAGGFRVSPLEVETTLSAFDGMQEIGVAEVAIKDGVTVIGCFYTSPAPLDEMALTAFAAAHLARYKQPRFYRRFDVLPRGANGKLLRKKLREMGQYGEA